MKKASNLLSKIVYSLFLVVFTIITFYCVRYSVFLRDFEFESHLVRGKDNIAVHVLVICAVLLLSCSISIALDRIKDERKRMRASICANVLVSFVTFSFCIIWLGGGEFLPHK